MAFSSHSKVSYPYGSGRKFEDMKYSGVSRSSDKGGPGHPDPEIVGVVLSKFFFFSAFRAPRAPPLVALLSLENYRGRSVFIPKVLRRPFIRIIANHILTLKCE